MDGRPSMACQFGSNDMLWLPETKRFTSFQSADYLVRIPGASHRSASGAQDEGAPIMPEDYGNSSGRTSSATVGLLTLAAMQPDRRERQPVANRDPKDIGGRTGFYLHTRTRRQAEKRHVLTTGEAFLRFAPDSGCVPICPPFVCVIACSNMKNGFQALFRRNPLGNIGESRFTFSS